MSLTIREALVNLAEKLGVDSTEMPTSNIADSIDFITEHFGGSSAGTGVIAEAVDNLTLTPSEDAGQDLL